MLTNRLSLDALRDLDRRHYLHPFTDSADLGENPARVVSEASGSHIVTRDGIRLLDGMAGLWCVHIGYGRKEMASAIAEQVETLPFFNSFFANVPEVTIELAAKLASLAPERINNFFFTSSGSEANDTIYKLARYFWMLEGKPDKRLFITRDYAYHGVSGVSTSLSGLTFMHPQWGYPFPEINSHIEGPYAFLHNPGLSDEDYGLHCAQALERKILELGADNIAAFMAEPVYGAGGIMLPPATYWPEINRICKKYDILLCADEVVCGFGRTGEWFGSQKYGIDPDFMTLAKGLTSGYVPMGAVGIADQVAATLRQKGGYLMHGFTYSGHPVAAAAALKNIEILEREKLVDRVRDDIGPYLQERFATLEDHPLVGEVRGVGSMAAIEIVADKATRAPFPDEAHAAFVAQFICADHGIIMRAMRDTLYCAPPFIITHDEVDTLVASTRASLDIAASVLAGD
jgi:putrescine---pyruvate transaminase